jgi:hypothetical protein
MTENGSEEALLVRAEPLPLADDVCRRMVDVVHLLDGAPSSSRLISRGWGRSTPC